MKLIIFLSIVVSFVNGSNFVDICSTVLMNKTFVEFAGCESYCQINGVDVPRKFQLQDADKIETLVNACDLGGDCPWPFNDCERGRLAIIDNAMKSECITKFLYLTETLTAANNKFAFGLVKESNYNGLWTFRHGSYQHSAPSWTNWASGYPKATGPTLTNAYFEVGDGLSGHWIDVAPTTVMRGICELAKECGRFDDSDYGDDDGEACTHGVCNEYHQCVKCAADNQCSEADLAKPFCYKGNCVACVIDAHCPTATPTCNACGADGATTTTVAPTTTGTSSTTTTPAPPTTCNTCIAA